MMSQLRGAILLVTAAVRVRTAWTVAACFLAVTAQSTRADDSTVALIRIYQIIGIVAARCSLELPESYYKDVKDQARYFYQDYDKGVELAKDAEDQALKGLGQRYCEVEKPIYDNYIASLTKK